MEHDDQLEHGPGCTCSGPRTLEEVAAYVKKIREAHPDSDENGFMWPEGHSFSGYMWMSFADEVDGESVNLGVILVKAASVIEGIINLRPLGINPGGEVLGVPIMAALADSVDMSHYENRLLAEEEALELQELFTDAYDAEVREPHESRAT